MHFKAFQILLICWTATAQTFTDLFGPSGLFVNPSLTLEASRNPSSLTDLLQNPPRTSLQSVFIGPPGLTLTPLDPVNQPLNTALVELVRLVRALEVVSSAVSNLRGVLSRLNPRVFAVFGDQFLLRVRSEVGRLVRDVEESLRQIRATGLVS